MRLKQVTEEEIKRLKKNNTGNLRKEAMRCLEVFLASEAQYCKVFDDMNMFYNNNDMRRTLQTQIDLLHIHVKVFMLSGEVYLKRL